MSAARSASQARWSRAAQLMAVIRGEPGITRAAAAQRLGIGTGGATDLVARLRSIRLLDESPAPAQGRGRPTTLLGPHPDGPVVLAAELRAGDWRLAEAAVDGAPRVVAERSHRRISSARLLSELGEAITDAHLSRGGRVRGKRLKRRRFRRLECGWKVAGKWLEVACHFLISS